MEQPTVQRQPPNSQYQRSAPTNTAPIRDRLEIYMLIH
jgi:hypothetical protein